MSGVRRSKNKNELQFAEWLTNQMLAVILMEDGQQGVGK